MKTLGEVREYLKSLGYSFDSFLQYMYRQWYIDCHKFEDDEVINEIDIESFIGSQKSKQ